MQCPRSIIAIRQRVDQSRSEKQVIELARTWCRGVVIVWSDTDARKINIRMVVVSSRRMYHADVATGVGCAGTMRLIFGVIGLRAEISIARDIALSRTR